ncbi:YicC/YloC family endoribonuclease, partial [Psychrobacter sp. TB20-MNA-CIBAN-0197]
VNQRYLETFIRAPEQFRGMEPVIRERLRKHLQRGKVEVFLKFVANPAHVGELSINQALAEQLINSAKWVQQQSNGDINPVDILRWPGVMEAEELDMDSVNTALIAGLDQVIEDFKSARGD